SFPDTPAVPPLIGLHQLLIGRTGIQ
ncbi:Stage V sporulation protein SpoVM, partial [Dysosmobacter welbionis]